MAIPPSIEGRSDNPVPRGLEFEDRGQHKLKGIPEARHLFSVTR